MKYSRKPSWNTIERQYEMMKKAERKALLRYTLVDISIFLLFIIVSTSVALVLKANNYTGLDALSGMYVSVFIMLIIASPVIIWNYRGQEKTRKEVSVDKFVYNNALIDAINKNNNNANLEQIILFLNNFNFKPLPRKINALQKYGIKKLSGGSDGIRNDLLELVNDGVLSINVNGNYEVNSNIK